MADCEFCGSGVDVEAQDMGEGRVMLLCASCRANIAAGEERGKETMANDQPQARHYMLSIPVTITDNTDLANFQPGTVVAETPLGHAWVSGTDGEALMQFFDFFVKTGIPSGMSIAEFCESDICRQQKEALRQIVVRAIREYKADAPTAK